MTGDILIVEDDPLHAEMTTAMLSSFDPSWSAIVVDNIEDARDVLVSRPIKATLLDLGLPRSKGTVTLRAYQEMDKTELVPLIVMTSDLDEAVGLEAVSLGAQDFVSKTDFSPSRLGHAICYAEQRHKLLSDIRRQRRSLESVVHALAHDIKSPANQIASAIAVALEDIDPDGQGSISDMLEHAAASARRLNRTIDGALKLARTGLAELQKELVALQELVHEVVSTLGLTEASRVSCDTSVTLVTDRALLGIVLQNLVGNGLKYSGETLSRVTVIAEQDSDGTRLFIRDTGCGMDERTLSRIFRPGYRGTNDDAEPGSGLGLSIVAQAVDLLQGRIEVSSTPGQGTEFILRLPKEQIARLN